MCAGEWSGVEWSASASLRETEPELPAHLEEFPAAVTDLMNGSRPTKKSFF